MSDQKQIDDSGPAFPSDTRHVCCGLTKREWFAGQALAGETILSLRQADYEGVSDEMRAAKAAYRLADAMIAVEKERA